ncbi:putative aminomethyltransferase, mitochondrial [Madurella mycetomatis]|uniref:Aminomethyltransferase n=1 Tax=Madurella mycetomatis TaxID=100816 RepID=A0A175W6D5_9PEZI|nr:putative aminomethyltransferase, mitochondrial [Madurella mycetomatis]
MQSTRQLTRALRASYRPQAHTAKRYHSRIIFQHPAQHQACPLQPVSTTPSRQLARFAQSRNASSDAASSSEGSADKTELQKTPLYDFHLAHGAKMVPFGGYYMPVQYSSLSVGQSHAFTREHCSIFDVSHMVQRVFSGPGAAQFLQRITPSGVETLEPHRSTLSCFLQTDGSGGIVDDTIITRLSEGRFYVVTNAACRDKDNAYLEREMAKWNSESGHEELQVHEEQLAGQGLVALQGPEAESILAQALEDGPDKLDLKKLLFGQSAFARLKIRDGAQISSPVLISRGGYTGEDGFEISIPGDETVDVSEALMAAGGPERVQLAGLGARDSLRLEAGMCLYGHDLNDSTTPVEAGLSWIIPKERRTADAGFYGADVISKQLVPRSKGGAGVQYRRVGLIVEGSPAREGAEILSRPEDGGEPVKLGTVTSGCPSPTLGKNIAMGYIKDGFHKAGTKVDVLVRKRQRGAVVTKMPFVPTRYWKGDGSSA